MKGTFTDIWVYLAATPLLGLTITLIAYVIGDWCYRRANMHPLLNPVLVAVVMLVALLAFTHTPYQTYFDGAQFVHFLLGPATVALAVPLYLHAQRLRKMWLPLLGGLVIGSVTAAVSAIAVAWLFGGSIETLLSLAPKSVTAPIAMGISEKIGGLASLTAILVVSTTGIHHWGSFSFSAMKANTSSIGRLIRTSAFTSNKTVSSLCPETQGGWCL